MGFRKAFMAAGLTLIVAHAALSDPLIYSLSEKGSQYRTDPASEGQGDAVKVDRKGYMVTDYDGRGNYGEPFMIYVDQAAGTWTAEPLGNGAKAVNMTTQQGLRVIITSSETTLAGALDVSAKVKAAKSMTGYRSWNHEYADGSEGAGNTKIQLTLDIKTTKACKATSAETATAAAAARGEDGLTVPDSIKAALGLDGLKEAQYERPVDQAASKLNLPMDESRGF